TRTSKRIAVPLRLLAGHCTTGVPDRGLLAEQSVPGALAEVFHRLIGLLLPGTGAVLRGQGGRRRVRCRILADFSARRRRGRGRDRRRRFLGSRWSVLAVEEAAEALHSLLPGLLAACG